MICIIRKLWWAFLCITEVIPDDHKKVTEKPPDLESKKSEDEKIEKEPEPEQQQAPGKSGGSAYSLTKQASSLRTVYIVGI